MKRIYYNYKQLEEMNAGLWARIHGMKRIELLESAIEFTGNADLYGSYMLRVIDEWPNSCEHNLTCIEMNRQAWIGHAACCLALGCPEDITRIAWHYLNLEQQTRANKKADEAILKWECTYIMQTNKQLEFDF